MKFPRRSGVLLHPTSLPGRYGIGDFGPEAYRFVDFLHAARQTYWQMLPLSPTGYADSPYQALSALAGNPLLISIDALVADGLLPAASVDQVPPFPTAHVDFGQVLPYKGALLTQAYATFAAGGQTGAAQDAAMQADFDAFCAAEQVWLDDYALFAALKEQFEQRPWYEWPRDIAGRAPAALAHWQTQLADVIRRHKFWQWLFFRQLDALKQYANARGVRLVGDIPIFVAHDCADVWVNADLFTLDEEFRPTIVSGVPPDYFSETGQLWGHPHYRWEVMAARGYAWWIARFRMMQRQADVIRIDHFRGFYNYWAVPGDATTAMVGEWRLGPGLDLFNAVAAALGDVPIIAEDLGDFDDESRAGVTAIQTAFDYPGMNILVFAFSGRDPQFLPDRARPESVTYTGTHDNDTAVGWFAQVTPAERDYVLQYTRTDGSHIAWTLTRLAWACPSQTAIVQAQDLLALDNRARMNTPGTVGAPNWTWRVAAGALDAALAARLAHLTYVHGRLPA